MAGQTPTYTEFGGLLGKTADGFSFNCDNAPTFPCFAGSASAVRARWTAGGGIEWLLDRHWSAKIKYQLVDLGTQTLRVASLSSEAAPCIVQRRAPRSIQRRSPRLELSLLI